jgi:hypothetical protein
MIIHVAHSYNLGENLHWLERCATLRYNGCSVMWRVATIIVA